MCCEPVIILLFPIRVIGFFLLLFLPSRFPRGRAVPETNRRHSRLGAVRHLRDLGEGFVFGEWGGGCYREKKTPTIPYDAGGWARDLVRAFAGPSVRSRFHTTLLDIESGETVKFYRLIPDGRMIPVVFIFSLRYGVSVTVSAPESFARRVSRSVGTIPTKRYDRRC